MVDWANAGGPNECKHGYAEGILCPRCCDEYNLQQLALDDLERDLEWTSTHVGSPGSEVRETSYRWRTALRALRVQAAADRELVAGYEQNEPPIVKGALDAQAEAEREVFRLRGLLASTELDLQRTQSFNRGLREGGCDYCPACVREQRIARDALR